MGSRYEIDRLSLGTYCLIAAEEGRTRADRQSAVLVFDVEEENLDGLDLHLRKGVRVVGHVQIEDREQKPDQPALPSDEVQVGLRPEIRMPFIDETPAPVRAEDGAFTIDGVILDTYQVSVSRAPRGYKVAKVSYNGILCPHGVVTIDPAAEVHLIDIVLSLANSSVSATVTDGIRPSAGATVLLASEPVDENALSHALRQVKTDEQGKATIDELLPGVYHVVAYAEGAMWVDDSNLTQRLAAGQEVKVSPNSIEFIQVRTLRLL